MITKSIQKHYNSLNVPIIESNIMSNNLVTNPDECQSFNLRNSTYSNKYSSQNTSLVPPMRLKNDWKESSLVYFLKTETLVLKQNELIQKSFQNTLNQLKANGFVKGKSFFKKEIKVTKFAILIIISFCVSWLPYTILAVIGQFVKNRETIVTPNSAYFATLFAKSSTLFNPILYLILKQRWKSKFRFITA